MERRSFLKGAGVVSIAVAGGGAWRACDQGVFSTGLDPAYEPWKDWRSEANEGPLALVRAAILAASPHNTQPWLFKVPIRRLNCTLIRGATWALTPGTREENELYRVIPHPHTNRSPYDPKRAIPAEFADALIRLPGNDPDLKVFLFTGEAERKKVVETSSAANREIYSDSTV